MGDAHRLPRHVLPARYDLRLEPDLTAATFTGDETITIALSRPVKTIILNAAELEITAATIENGPPPTAKAFGVAFAANNAVEKSTML